MLGVVYLEAVLVGDSSHLGINPRAASAYAVRDKHGDCRVERRPGLWFGREQERRDRWRVRTAKLDNPATLLLQPLEPDDGVRFSASLRWLA
jgi:hypothetical protein